MVTSPGRTGSGISFRGSFALVMATGIVAVAARLLRYQWPSWSLFVIALLPGR